MIPTLRIARECLLTLVVATCLAILLPTVDSDVTTAFEILENSRKLSSNSHILKIRCTNIPKLEFPHLRIEFTPILVQGEDYDIVVPKYVIPPGYRYGKEKFGIEIKLKLRQGKSWSGSLNHVNGSSQVPLIITKIKFNNQEMKLDRPVKVATIVRSRRHCPNIPSLPGANPSVMKLIKDALSTCEGVRIQPSKKLNRRHWSSFSLLDLEPPLLLVDGADQSIEAAANSVDHFLAAHAVLEIAWEPMHPNDPSWWVLVPRPQGMPGHMFAVLDAVQWKHPLVSRADYHRAHKNCTTVAGGQQHCVPGCPGTLLTRFIASGYNADTGGIAGGLRKAMFVNKPFQAAPLRLGWRLTPPQWGGTIGWTYTFQGCASSFLDCFFLDHSPCPMVDIDIREDSMNALVSQNRKKEPEAWMSDEIDWYHKLTGAGIDLPAHSIGGFVTGIPIMQVMYAYLFRPKYHIRREVQRRVDNFNIEKDSCAAMHVRRGDSVMHTGQARAYIPIETYVRAGRPLMDALSITTILLFTDSATAIEEALSCEKEFPDICRGIKFRFIDKKRWKGAEGGWENPFPTQNATEEFLIIQNEFSLAQKCSMAILGNSGYGDLIYSHMCCGFPVAPRGSLPTKCVCPPKVELKQYDFNCEHGNKLLCSKVDVGGNIHKRLDDPENMAGANYSFTKDAFKRNPQVKYFVASEVNIEMMLSELNNKHKELNSYTRLAREDLCNYRRTVDSKFKFCNNEF